MLLKKRIPRRLVATSFAVLLLVFVGLLLFHFRPGIQVTIQNTGSTAMRSVVLHVTGNSYNLGDISPGTSATARVRPTSESHLEIEFTDSDGKVLRLDAGGYFESGYRGTINVSIKNGTIVTNQQDIKLW